MNRYSRLLLAVVILLSGAALIPQVNLFAGSVSWQRFAGGYEDQVTITLARFVTSREGGGTLEVHATNTAGGNATLSVYRTSDNTFIGTLIYNGTDHRGAFPLPTNPQMITVRSSLGGTGATAPTPEIPTAVEVASLGTDPAGNNGLMIAALALAGLAGLAALVAVRRR